MADKKGEIYPTSHLTENTPTANSEDWPYSAVWRDGSAVDAKGELFGVWFVVRVWELFGVWFVVRVWEF